MIFWYMKLLLSWRCDVRKVAMSCCPFQSHWIWNFSTSEECVWCGMNHCRVTYRWAQHPFTYLCWLAQALAWGAGRNLRSQRSPRLLRPQSSPTIHTSAQDCVAYYPLTSYEDFFYFYLIKASDQASSSLPINWISSTRLINATNHGVLGFWGFGVLGL